MEYLEKIRSNFVNTYGWNSNEFFKNLDEVIREYKNYHR